MAGNSVNITTQLKGFKKELQFLKALGDSIDDKFLKSTQRRHLQPMVEDMKANSKSDDIKEMIGITQAKKKTGNSGFAVKAGVVKNDTNLFPKFSAQALASVIEYGTELRRHESGKNVGYIEEGPFLRPAYDKNVAQFMKKVEESAIRKVKRTG